MLPSMGLQKSWKPGGPHAQRAAAKRSYPTSEVRGSGREYQTAVAQERPKLGLMICFSHPGKRHGFDPWVGKIP